MLPRKLRLSRRGFEEMRGSRRASSLHFSLSYTDCASKGGTAIVIPKKVVRSSVDRHRLKRRLLPLLAPYAAPSRALVLSVRSGAAEIPYPALQDELISLLRSILSAR